VSVFTFVLGMIAGFGLAILLSVLLYLIERADKQKQMGAE